MTHIAPSTVHAILYVIYNQCKNGFTKLDITGTFKTHNVGRDEYLIYSMLQLGYLSRKMVHGKMGPGTRRTHRYIYKWNTDEPTLAMVDRVIQNKPITYHAYSLARKAGHHAEYIENLGLVETAEIIRIEPSKRKYTRRSLKKSVTDFTPDAPFIKEEKYFVFDIRTSMHVSVKDAGDSVYIHINGEESFGMLKTDLADFGTSLVRIAARLAKDI